jgi:hypothetical protein
VVGSKKHKWRLRVPTTDSAPVWAQVLNDVAATATAGRQSSEARWDGAMLSSRRSLEHASFVQGRGNQPPPGTEAGGGPAAGPWQAGGAADKLLVQRTGGRRYGEMADRRARLMQLDGMAGVPNAVADADAGLSTGGRLSKGHGRHSSGRHRITPDSGGERRPAVGEADALLVQWAASNNAAELANRRARMMREDRDAAGVASSTSDEDELSTTRPIVEVYPDTAVYSRGPMAT